MILDITVTYWPLGGKIAFTTSVFVQEITFNQVTIKNYKTNSMKAIIWKCQKSIPISLFTGIHEYLYSHGIHEGRRKWISSVRNLWVLSA